MANGRFQRSQLYAALVFVVVLLFAQNADVGVPHAEAATGAALVVRNRTPYVVILYVGGIRVGWLRGYRSGKIRGLRPGYHQLYAHSRWGSTSWGPRRLWLPGRWTLQR